MSHFAQQLQDSPRQRHLFFLVLTAVAILAIGYRFGTFDQSFHIPFLKAYANPALYPEDPIVSLRWQNYSFFWRGLQPFYMLDLRLGLEEPVVLETAVFVVHVLCTYLTFWAIWLLAQELFHNPLTSLIAVCSFVIPHVGQSGLPIIEFSLLNRTFVLPFVLLGLRLQLQERTWLALSLLGILFNLHVITALIGLAMILCDCAFNWKRLGVWQIVLGLASFALLASPVFIWKASGPAVDLGVNREWFTFIVRSVLHNMYAYWGAPYVNVMTLGGLGVLLLYGLARRLAPSQLHARSQDAFFLAILLILLVHSVSMYLFPITVFMELQLMRAAQFGLILAYISFANYLAARYKSGRDGWLLVAGTTVLSPTPLFPPLAWGLDRWLPAWRGRILLAAGIVVGLMMAWVAYLFQYKDILAVGVDIYPARTDWYLAQRWAHDHTPLDAVFITPPQIWSYNDSDWRVFSERSTVASLTDALEIALNPDYLSIWQPRFEALAPGATAQFRGDYFQNKSISARAFYGLTAAQLKKIAVDYHASYLVMEKPNLRSFFLCYENSQYIIYALSDTAATQSGCAAR